MDDDNRLHRLMTGLIRGAPPQPERMVAVLDKASQIRRRRRTYVAAGTAVLALASGVLLLGPGGRSTRDDLVASAPTPTEAASSTPSPTSTADVSPAPVPPPTTGQLTPSPTARPESMDVTADALLSDDYVEKAFGGGAPARTSSSSAAVPGLIRSCYHLVDRTAQPEEFVARSWYWPGEVVVSQAIARESSERAAGARFTTCTDPSASGFDPDAESYASDGGTPRVQDVDLMEHGTGIVVVVPRSLDTSVYAAAVVGRTVLVLTWRQSGAIPSEDAIVRALVSAVRRATGGDQSRPVAAAAPQFPTELKGFLTRKDLAHPLPWTHDAQEGSAALRCGDGLAPTTAPPVARTWEATADDVTIPNPSITIRFARAVDGTTAAAGFSACKEGFSRRQRVHEPTGEGVGDESFWFAPDPRSTTFVVRSGSAYLEVQYFSGSYDETLALARSALDALSAAGRLS